MRQKTPGRKLLTAKTVFFVSIIVAALTILGIWLFGLGQHRTLYENSILSTSILSAAFCLFITIGLFNGVKLKDDLGQITDKISIGKMPDLSGGLEFPSDAPSIGDDVASALVGVLFWILFSILLVVFIWLFSGLLWATVLAFAAMLYWIFFRALRLVFKNANKCKNSLTKSFAYGVFYTILYNFWIYGVIFLMHYGVK